MPERTDAKGSAYALQHQEAGIGRRYDEEIYAGGGYDDFIWSLQRPVVVDVLKRARTELGSLCYLDFACGTGRVIGTVESLVDSSTGLDISPHMLEPARSKVQRSDLVVGDILADDQVAPGPFDVVTAFRFFLNTEPEMRAAVLPKLRQRMAGPRSLLLFNIHGNLHSSLGLTSIYRQLRGWGAARLMSRREITGMVESAGFAVERVYGFGLSPRRAYTGALSGPVHALDRATAGRTLVGRAGHDLLFVCRRGA